MSLTEILIVLLIALVVLGPERIPAVARKLGEWFRQIRRMSNVFRETLMLEDESRRLDGSGWPNETTHGDDGSSEAESGPPTPIDQGPIDGPSADDVPESVREARRSPQAVSRRELAGLRHVELASTGAAPALEHVPVDPAGSSPPGRPVDLHRPALPRF